MWTVDPKFPLGLWWALVVAAVATVAWYAVRSQWRLPTARKILLTALLAIGFAGPLAIALNPTWVEAVPPLPGNPMLSVLVDGTLSMNTVDVGTQTPQSRWERATELTKEVRPDGTSLEVRELYFNSQIHPVQQSAKDWPNGHQSDLANAIRQTTRSGSPLGHAVLMISDGAHNVGSVDGLLQAAREANALATPIYTVALGTSIGMKNMSLTAKSARMIAFPNSPVAIRVNIGHSGLAGQQTEVSLLRDDEVVESKVVRLNNDPVQEVRFLLEKGVQGPLERFRIVASEVPEEVTIADNQTTVMVQQLSAPIGVLVLEGKPYWDSKFLSRNLSSDPVVELTSIMRVGKGRFLRRKVEPPPFASPGSTQSDEGNNETVGDNEQPTEQPTAGSDDQWSVAKELESPLESSSLLDEYRVVVLGRDADVFLTSKAIENLRLWIAQNGGCLMCARGAPMDQVTTKLAEILPVRWADGSESRFRTELSTFGLDSAIFDPLLDKGSDPLGTLPSLATSSRPKTRSSLPQILVQSTDGGSGEAIPVVTYQPYGSGQTVVIEGAGMWRWAFLPPQHADKDKIYPTLWQSLIQWIISQQDVMPGQTIAVRTDRANFLSGDRATATVILKEPGKWLSDKGQLDLSALVQSSEQELPQRVSLVPSGMEEGMYRIDMGMLSVGYYTLKIISGEKDIVQAATAFEVRDPWFESLEVDARPDILAQVARLSGGEVIKPEEIASLPQRFADKLKREQRHEETRTSLWDRPLVFLIVLGCWIGTWVIRRQSGLT